jgi:hypothetical protein
MFPKGRITSLSPVYLKKFGSGPMENLMLLSIPHRRGSVVKKD